MHEGNIITNGTNSLSKRHTIITDINRSMYEKEILMKPRIEMTNLPSGQNSNVVTFSMKEMILRMVMNKSLFNADNILLDPHNSLLDPLDSIYYGEVNTGTWFKETKHKECTLPKQILMLFCQFIDRLSVQKYDNITVEMGLSCF